MPTTIKKIRENITISYEKKDAQTIKSWIDFVPPILQNLSKIPQENTNQLFNSNIGSTFLPLFSTSKEKTILSLALFNLIRNSNPQDRNGDAILISDPENLPIGKKLIKLANKIIGDKYGNSIKYKLFVLNSCRPEIMHQDNSLFTIGFSVGGLSTLITNRSISNQILSGKDIPTQIIKKCATFPEKQELIDTKELSSLDKEKILNLNKSLINSSHSIPEGSFGIWDGQDSIRGGVWHSSPAYCPISNNPQDTRLFFGLSAYRRI